MYARRWMIFSLAVMGALELAGCGEKAPSSEPVIRPVRYQEVISSGARRERKFSGTARAGVESQLSFRVPGIVQSVSVVVGDTVGQGREIARLDATDYQLQLQEAQAALAQARAAERKATADWDRAGELYADENVSKREYDAERAVAESAAAEVESRSQRLELVRRQLGYTRLLAPIDGAIASVLAEVNENVEAGETIALLTSGSRPEVEVAMPGVLISQVQEGDAAKVTFDALPGANFPALITEVGVAATSTGATFPVTVQLSATDSSVRPGMAATVAFRFESGDRRERIFLPPVAVGEDRQGRFVFVLNAGGENPGDGAVATVMRRPVTVGDLTPDGLEVIDGLTEGEWLVTAGVRRIHDGQHVRLLPGHAG